MIRKISIDVYRKIEAEGLLSKLQWEVYSTVFHHGPMTSGECFSMLAGRKSRASPLIQMWARFTELQDMGVLRELGTRPCKVTGRVAIEWDVSGKLPTSVSRKRTRSCPTC